MPGEALRYDQGIFNTACKLAQEINSRGYLFFLCEVDASGIERLRTRARRQGTDKTAPTYTAIVVKAVASALREHPHLNAMIQRRPFSTRLAPLNTMTATVAVERCVGGIDYVFAPMLDSPEGRPLADLSAELQHYAQAEPETVPVFAKFMRLVRWARYFPSVVGLLFRIPGLSPALWRRFRGGSFVVTSPAKYGGLDAVLPPWPWPLTIAFGQVKERPWVAAGKVVVRKTMHLTIAAERILANGAPLARFAETLRRLLEEPERLEMEQAPANREGAEAGCCDEMAVPLCPKISFSTSTVQEGPSWQAPGNSNPAPMATQSSTQTRCQSSGDYLVINGDGPSAMHALAVGSG